MYLGTLGPRPWSPKTSHDSGWEKIKFKTLKKIKKIKEEEEEEA